MPSSFRKAKVGRGSGISLSPDAKRLAALLNVDADTVVVVKPGYEPPTPVKEGLDDVEDDAAYIGRGPTPRGVYEVIEGDTLCSIAGCFNLDVVEIIDKNGDVIKNPDELAPGDRIRIY